MGGSVIDFNDALPLAALEARIRRSEVDAEDVKARITASAQSFVEWLFSGRAHVARGEARIGDVHGTPGASLSIALIGPSAGLWRDHATGEGGDLIGLFQAHMGYEGNRNFQLAIKEIAAEFLGDPVEVRRGPFQETVATRIAEKKAKLGTKPRADMLELGPPVATWRYVDLKGNQLASVVRYEPDGTPESKTYRPYSLRWIDGRPKWAAGVPDLRPLYNLPGIATEAVVILCEGEKAAQALADLGIAATTAMQGAEAPIEKTDWSPLNGKTVVVWPDNDAPGLKYGAAVAARLVALGCTVRVVPIPGYATDKWDAADAVAEGRDVRALIQASVLTEKAEKPRIRLMTLSEMESLPPLAWLIEDVITENGLSMIWGRSGSLKSFVAIDMAMAVATGQPWQGKPVKHGRVIYVAAEGAFGLARRAIGWRQHRANGITPDLLLVPHGLTLTSDDCDALIQAIKDAGPGPVFVIFDTMSRTFGGGNPNQPADMNLYVQAVDRVRTETGAHVLVVHHAGEDEERNEIGNKGLRNACDTVIFVKRAGDKVQLVNEAPKGKQKDAEEFKTINLRPVKVAYQMGSDGSEEHSTLVLTPDEGSLVRSDEDEEAPKQRLGSVEKRIVAVLGKAGEPLGLLRISSASGVQKGTVHTSLKSLEGKGVIVKTRSADDSRDEWRMADETFQ